MSVALLVVRRSVDLGQAEDLSGVYQIGILNLILVCGENDGVTPPRTIVRLRNVPEIVSLHDVQPPAVGARDRRHDNALEWQFEARDGLAVDEYIRGTIDYRGGRKTLMVGT